MQHVTHTRQGLSGLVYLCSVAVAAMHAERSYANMKVHELSDDDGNLSQKFTAT